MSKFLPYHYYATATSTARLCELDESGFVYFADEERYSAHRTRYSGRFVRLLEDVSELAAQWPTLDEIQQPVDSASE